MMNKADREAYWQAMYDQVYATFGLVDLLPLGDPDEPRLYHAFRELIELVMVIGSRDKPRTNMRKLSVPATRLLGLIPKVEDCTIDACPDLWSLNYTSFLDYIRNKKQPNKRRKKGEKNEPG